jgi:acyl-CoA reductase-like NAD-dependent aldehyde dehydrogenase
MALKVTNPADGNRIATLPADDAKSVKAKYERARASQPAGRGCDEAAPEAIRASALVVADAERPRACSSEVGKPIAQAGTS